MLFREKIVFTVNSIADGAIQYSIRLLKGMCRLRSLRMIMWRRPDQRPGIGLILAAMSLGPPKLTPAHF